MPIETTVGHGAFAYNEPTPYFPQCFQSHLELVFHFLLDTHPIYPFYSL